MPQWARDRQRLLFDNGWLLPAQPPEFGGRNATASSSSSTSTNRAVAAVTSFNPRV
jgi:hypothetical protein